VSSIINRKIETKLSIGPPINLNTNQTLQDFVTFSTAITSTNELYQLIPSVTQGNDDHQRVGDTIQPVKLTTKVNIALTDRSVNAMSIYAHIFFLTSKNVKDWKLTAAIPTASLMDLGDGTNVPFDGTSYTAMLPINKSEFNVIAHKKILLQKPKDNPNSIYQQDEDPVTSTCTHFANFSVNVPLPKKLMYLTDADNYPTNAFPFMCMGFTATDQYGAVASTILMLKVQAQSHLYYKDA